MTQPEAQQTSALNQQLAIAERGAGEVLGVLSAVTQDTLVLFEPLTADDGRQDFVCVWSNGAAARMLRRDASTLRGERVLSVLPNGGQLYDVLLDTYRSGEIHSGELDVAPVAAAVTRISYRVVPVDGVLALSVLDHSTARQVEERAASLEQMVLTGAQLSTVAAAVLRPLVDRDGSVTDLVIEYVNGPGAMLFNATPEALIGSTVREVVGLRQLPTNGVFLRIAKSWQAQVAEAFDIEAIRSPLPQMWLRCHVTPLDEVVIVHADDITKRLDEEAALRASEQRYRSLFDTANEGIALASLDGRFLIVNNTFAAMFGLRRHELIGRSALDFVDESERESTISDAHDAVDGTARSLRRPVRYRRPDGSLFWAISASTVTRDEEGTITGFLIMALDIDDREQALEALRTSEARYRAIVEHADVLIALTDEHGQVEFINDRLSKLLGIDPADVIGRSAIGFYAPDDKRHIIDDFRRLNTDSRPITRSRNSLVAADGRHVPTIGSAVGLYGSGQERPLEGIVLVGADVSQIIEQENARRELAAALAVAEQSERERLASDLHDGPVQRLSALSMRLGAASLSGDVDEQLLTFAEDVLTSTIGELRSLLFQLTPPDLQAEQLGHALLARATKLLAADVTVALDDHISTPLADETAQALFRIGQEAIVNVAKHAYASAVRISLSETSTDFILEVEDNGIGGRPDHFRRAGYGHLGLRSMTDRARQIGGRCEISSEPGVGTTVFLRIPRTHG